MGGRTSAFPKGEPAVTPVLPVPLASFPIILEVELAKYFLGGGIGTSFPRAFAPLWKGASPPAPCSVVTGFPRCCLSPVLPLVSSQLWQRGT